MRAIRVQPNDLSNASAVDATSLSQAVQAAQSGDVILLEPGTYAPAQTGERLPVRIPAGVAVEGAGADDCIIDGEGVGEPSFHPIQPDEAVIVLENGASLSGVTVTNGGGHGIGLPVGGNATIRNCTISRHGDHGIFVCGVTEAIITQCVFQHNGLKRFEPKLPRGVGARQGHHVFAEARHGQANRLIVTDNVMQDCFADGIAFICFFPEPDQVAYAATILRNSIESSERGGLLFSCSFGPSHNRFHIVAADNILRKNKQFGINIITALPLAEKVPQHNQLHGLFSGNTISESPIGIAVQGAVGEAQHNACTVVLDRNQIVDCAKNALRLVGATGMDGVATQHNTLEAVVSRNTITGSVVVQGAGGPSGATLRGNTATVGLQRNTGTASDAQNIQVSDGLAGNQAGIANGSQAYRRTTEDLL